MAQSKNIDDPFEDTMPTVHEVIRKSELLKEFSEKLKSPICQTFPFAAQFLKLRDLVTLQIGDTRILFPEFTPHDEPLHVVKLFQLADKMFGAHIYKNLNASELFLFGLALYAHDWGMAIGQDEKTFLCKGAPKELLRDTFAPLPDEADRLHAFILNKGLKNTEGFKSLSDDYLRQYVRETHARRSGARVRAHFTAYPAIGEALAHICEGHWHDFPTLDDPERFPRAYEVAGQTAHVLAITLQVRLVDLFHITDDRTPFALWRFVSPADARSADEWKKHRALHGVSVIDFPPGRAIRVQGFTENEEVWAGLQDLRRYCEDQIRGCLDISARHVPARYGLDFLQLEWAVSTGDLRPVDFRFEFDRAAMFRILSDDIYDGNHYVFLRELLQNAIDAIHTRYKRRLQLASTKTKKKSTAPSFDTTIYIKAEHKTNGDILVSCRDYGIGMDEHIIRNYFTVAGVSYYRSSEFERQQLCFEPISRFGVGILSCFMVADKIQVKTYRDPECGPPMVHADLQLADAKEHHARRLKLEIPGVQRQFIVKNLNDGFEVGTEVEVQVKAQKLRKPGLQTREENGLIPEQDTGNTLIFSRLLEVTEYISEIAGFVQFPILVEEHWPGLKSPKNTLILHPDRDPEIEKSNYEGEINVSQLCRSYPLREVVDPHSLPAAQKALTESRFDLQKIMENEGYEGWVVFLKPTNESWDFTNRETQFDYGQNKTIWRDRTTGNSPAPDVRWVDQHLHKPNKRITKALFKVFRDGILLQSVDGVTVYQGRGAFPNPLVCVNLPGSIAPITNVARSLLKIEKSKWFDPIQNAIEKALKNEMLSVLDLSPKERFFRIGWLVTIFRLRHQSINKYIPEDKAVTVWLTQSTQLQFCEGLPAIGTEVPLVPEELRSVVLDLFSKLFYKEPSPPTNIFWEGQDSLIQDLYIYWSLPMSAAINCVSSVTYGIMSTNRLQFLEPPPAISNPLEQLVASVHEQIPDWSAAEDENKEANDPESFFRMKMLKDKEVLNCLSLAKANSSGISPRDRRIIERLLGTFAMGSRLLPLPFSPPFAACWATENGAINALHEYGKIITSCLLALARAQDDTGFGYQLANRLSALFEKQIYFPNETSTGYAKAESFAKELFEVFINYKICTEFSAPMTPPNHDNVPEIKSTEKITKTFEPFSHSYSLKDVKGRCGRLITKWP